MLVGDVAPLRAPGLYVAWGDWFAWSCVAISPRMPARGIGRVALAPDLAPHLDAAVGEAHGGRLDLAHDVGTDAFAFAHFAQRRHAFDLDPRDATLRARVPLRALDAHR